MTAMDFALADLEVFVREKSFDDGFGTRVPDDEYCGSAESEGSSRTCLCECYKKVKGKYEKNPSSFDLTLSRTNLRSMICTQP